VYFTCSSLLKGAEQYFHQLSVFLLLVSLATFYLACQLFYCLFLAMLMLMFSFLFTVFETSWKFDSYLHTFLWYFCWLWHAKPNITVWFVI